jgi:protein ImuB
MYACLYQPLAPSACDAAPSSIPVGAELAPPDTDLQRRRAEQARPLQAIAQSFSPRYECHGDDLITIDVSGLDRLLGPPRVVGEELRHACADRGVRAHVAMASTWTSAAILAHARAGLTVIPRGGEAEALAPISVASLQSPVASLNIDASAIPVFTRWGIRTLGEVAALPSDDLAARLGRASLMWQAMARGEDVRPLIPTLEAERFESSLDLEWPIEELEPLSFVLTRLLEPLAVRLERRDRGASVLHVVLRLVTRELYARRLELPSPMRDVRTLRTLALLDLESHPTPAAIDRVTIVIDPTPGRVLQHTLFTRAHPTPEQISTLLARLTALMGQDRIGAPAVIDTDRPGAFAMAPFATEHASKSEVRSQKSEVGRDRTSDFRLETSDLRQALRRCRHPVPARVAVDAGGRPARVTTDRRGFAGGSAIACAGPWRTSGNWWESEPGRTGRAGEDFSHLPHLPNPPHLPRLPWDRDEWDVSLNDGAVYRIFRDRATGAWFIDAIVD